MFFTDSIEKPPDVGIVGVVTGDGNTLTPCCGDLVGSVLDGVRELGNGWIAADAPTRNVDKASRSAERHSNPATRTTTRPGHQRNSA